MTTNLMRHSFRGGLLAALLTVGLGGCGGGGTSGGSGGGGGGGGGGGTVELYNPSFETLGGNSDGFQPDGWVRTGLNRSIYGVKRKTGAGFMPTDGQFFLEFPSMADGGSSSFSYYPDLTVYQDDVDLSGASDLVFDYEIANRSILTGGGAVGYDGEARVRIFFQPNGGGSGTVDLWARAYGPGTDGSQVYDEIVPLPDLPVPGRLTISVETDPSRTDTRIQKTTFTFRIDYIRLQ